LRTARAGRTTVVATASPLVLPQVDSVCWVRDGHVVARGTHAELLDRDAQYRRFVTRDAGVPVPRGANPDVEGTT
jgi:ABC-type multidrug transport system fused ATPase/permease subunit